MDKNSLKVALQDASKNVYKAVNSVGTASIDVIKAEKNFVSEHTPDALKNIKTPKTVDTFVKTAKEKAPGFVKDGVKAAKNHKETIVGAAVILAAVGCALKLVDIIADKIKELRPQGKHLAGNIKYYNSVKAHQG